MLLGNSDVTARRLTHMLASSADLSDVMLLAIDSSSSLNVHVLACALSSVHVTRSTCLVQGGEARDDELAFTELARYG